MEGRDRDEFAALRHAIATRATARPALMLAGVSAWAGVLVAVLVWLPYPVASAIPLVVLVAAYEGLRPLHLGAERIGRYLQAFHEEGIGALPPLSDPPAWERVAMVFGPGAPGAGGHPLFAPVFALAALVNYLAVVLPGPVPLELGAMAVPHLGFIAWLVVTDRAMRAQRAAELTRFREIRDSGL